MMSGVGFFEILLLCMIGLIVLGPKRLPQVANQIGTWVGQARRMTRTLKRQLEEELDVEKNLGFDPKKMHIPMDDDTYSPVHDADNESPAPTHAAQDSASPAEPESGKDQQEQKQDA